MSQREEVLKVFRTWQKKLEDAIREKDGNAMCESTRMVLAFALSLDAYFPDELTPEIRTKVIWSFKKALAAVTDQLQDNPDGCYDLYTRNIKERLKTLNELGQRPQPLAQRT